MTIYTATTATTATHTIEVFRGQQPTAEGEDFGCFFAGDVQAADSVLSWMEEHGVVVDDTDVYALVVEAGSGQDNQPIAILPIAPAVEQNPALIAEQTAARNLGGRPSVATDGKTDRVTVTIPSAATAALDAQAKGLGTTRSDLIRRAAMDAVASRKALTGIQDIRWAMPIDVITWSESRRNPIGLHDTDVVDLNVQVDLVSGASLAGVVTLKVTDLVDCSVSAKSGEPVDGAFRAMVLSPWMARRIISLAKDAVEACAEGVAGPCLCGSLMYPDTCWADCAAQWQDLVDWAAIPWAGPEEDQRAAALLQKWQQELKKIVLAYVDLPLPSMQGWDIIPPVVAGDDEVQAVRAVATNNGWPQPTERTTDMGFGEVKILFAALPEGWDADIRQELTQLAEEYRWRHNPPELPEAPAEIQLLPLSVPAA